MLCPNCETENSDDARLCVECGFPLSGAVSRGAGATSPAKAPSPYQRQVPPSDQFAVNANAPQAFTPDPFLGNANNPHDFSWDAPLNEENPAQGLFEPTRTLHPVSDGPFPREQTESVGRAHAPQIVQVDLQGRVIAPEASERMQSQDHSVPSSNAPGGVYSEVLPHDADDGRLEPYFDDYYDDAFDAVFEEAQEMHVSSSRQFEEQSTGRIPQIKQQGQTQGLIPEQSQEEFDAFYRTETVLQTNTIPFDDARAAGYQEARAYANAHEQTSVLKDDRPRSARNYRIPQKKKGLTGKQRGLIVGGVALVVAALVLVVGFAFGIWSGIPVPNVENMTQDEAVRILEENGFTTKVVEVKFDEIEGRVIGTDPKAGTFTEEGSEITVQVAIARTIPDVVGDDLETARQKLEESGYTNIKIQMERNNGPENIVLSTTPAAQTRAKSTMEITLTISENYKVPDISGMSYDEAVAAIEQADLTATVAYIDTEQFPDGTIIGTNPEAGTKVDEGSSVAINIARKRGVELNALASEYLAAGNTVTIAGVNYQIESITSVSYQGNDVVNFTIQARPFVEFFGETLFASSTQSVSGSIQYNSANEIVSIS